MGAFTYPRSEPGSAGHQDLVERLNAISPALRRELDGMAETALAYRPADGEWSIQEVLGHLCDNARFLHQRLFVMINQEEPRLASWDQDEQFRLRDPQRTPVSELLAEFAGQRGETVTMLADLVHWNWARQGRHEERGRLSIRQLVDIAIEHEEGHLEHIRTLKEQAETATS